MISDYYDIPLLLRDATPGPWQVMPGRTLHHVETGEGCPAGMGVPVVSVARRVTGAGDADLIAAAPDLAARCLALERALKTALTRLRDEADDATDRDFALVLGELADEIEYETRRMEP